MSLSVQFVSLLAMIGTGILSAALIDLVYSLKSSIYLPKLLRKYMIAFELLAWIIAGCWSFYVLYLIRDGEWRIYDPFAQISGLLLYASIFYKPFRLLGRLIVFVILKPIYIIGFALWRIIRLLFKPIVLLLNWIIGIVSGIFSFKFKRNFKNEEK